MKKTAFQRGAAALALALLALVLFGGTGFLLGKQFSAKRKTKSSGSKLEDLLTNTAAEKDDDDDDDDEWKQPLFRALAEAIDEYSEDIEEEDEREALRILREADDILTRIKRENEIGLKRANTPPKRRHHKRKPKQQPEKKPQEKQNDQPAEKPKPDA